jgi:hypothetical protein
MSEDNLNGWSVEQNHNRSIVLTSSEGEMSVNRSEGEKSKQTWYVDFKPQNREPESWKVQVENRDELLTQALPRIINERLPP